MKVEVLETGYVSKIAAGTTNQSNEWIEEFVDEGNIVEIGRCGFYIHSLLFFEGIPLTAVCAASVPF